MATATEHPALSAVPAGGDPRRAGRRLRLAALLLLLGAVAALGGCMVYPHDDDDDHGYGYSPYPPPAYGYPPPAYGYPPMGYGWGDREGDDD
jgi:hypothetical protein